MPRRVKDEERVEMIIRGLLKQPDNRRCINCNSLGPQYVCTTFWTFVCTNCSGVHREFTHRVKSVSMAKFNDEELMSLQAGGNERAKQIYFKNWDPHLNSYPDTNNLQKLRQFVNNVYIEKKYAGVNSSHKQPVAKSESKNSYCGSPSMSPQWGRRDDFLGRSSVERGSSKDEFIYDRSLFEKSSSSKGGKGLNLKDFLEERTPRNSQEMPTLPRSSNQRSRSARFEIVDDRFREDGSVRRYERNSFRDTGSGGRSPSSSLKSASSLPIVRPLNVILGDKSLDLRVDDHKDGEGSARSQKAADEVSGESKKAANADDASKKENEAKGSTSLTDFLEPEAQAEETERASDSNNENRSIATSTTEATAIVPINSVEALLLELSAPVASSSSDQSTLQMPSPETAQNSTLQMSPPLEPEQNSTNASEVETAAAPETSNSSETLALTVIKSDKILEKEEENAAEIQTNQHQFPYSSSSTTLQSASSVESSLNEQGNRPSPAPDDLRRTKSVPVVQSTEAATSSQSVRKEIPEDLFTCAFPSFTPAVHPWHMPHGVGYNMQFHHPHEHVLFQQPMAGYPNPSRPKNPFDIDDDRFHVQPPTFPSMSPMQGAFQSMPNPAASQPRPSPYVTPLSYPSHMNSYGMNMPLVPGAYMAQQSNDMLLPRPEENANVGGIEDVFASLNPIARGAGSHSMPSPPPSSLPRGGNPFG